MFYNCFILLKKLDLNLLSEFKFNKHKKKIAMSHQIYL